MEFNEEVTIPPIVFNVFGRLLKEISLMNTVNIIQICNDFDLWVWV